MNRGGRNACPRQLKELTALVLEEPEAEEIEAEGPEEHTTEVKEEKGLRRDQ